MPTLVLEFFENFESNSLFTHKAYVYLLKGALSFEDMFEVDFDRKNDTECYETSFSLC